jgi:hypothetical protein
VGAGKYWPDPKAREGGTSRFNGVYWPDPKAAQGNGFSRPYLREGDTTNPSVIEYSPGVWRVAEGYSPPFYYYCHSTSETPPLDGWLIGDAVEPGNALSPPTLKVIERCKRCKNRWKEHECRPAADGPVRLPYLSN